HAGSLPPRTSRSRAGDVRSCPSTAGSSARSSGRCLSTLSVPFRPPPPRQAAAARGRHGDPPARGLRPRGPFARSTARRRRAATSRGDGPPSCCAPSRGGESLGLGRLGGLVLLRRGLLGRGLLGGRLLGRSLLGRGLLRRGLLLGVLGLRLVGLRRSLLGRGLLGGRLLGRSLLGRG